MDIKQLDKKTELKQRIFFALSDPGRYKIVCMLYSVGHEMGCNELNQHVEIDKSTMSYHLRTLREIGITSTRTQGRQKYVSLNKDWIETLIPGLLSHL
ncbi:ArsR/SmtB family transcription factor [Liquorilactobacillus mali]|uniref:Transcriptional regulator n=2 Tax=Liquorilactobacillus mali TaxID=1618 RepID=A0A0R2E0M3_9LACO|nr:metalloregulator ArsR/SmtB family transcription factor [Liquorilactobacillus mali]KRN09753.1 transcriptional regulator [Liquorilactobacillus mali KCTC 3596 = DSM 20444]KRN29100.1 transcriptional regulator [Liquorilactobacillus mali]MDC7953342.1 winged helix-turn-helix transcriptional regulator [Liquorilactobacillus mali]MDN7146224.1 metalloregulator ArsR/SmtB family transcription factor [Liquorilactobacillus mali]MDV7758472.1 metalloregulator ArsR/SmtB family transcription factor [Liquorila